MKQFPYRPNTQAQDVLNGVAPGKRNGFVNTAVIALDELTDALEALVDKRDGAQQVARLLLRQYKRSDIRHFQKP